ncbi:MAG: DUF3466 family protein [Acidobacteriota bacterium]
MYRQFISFVAMSAANSAFALSATLTDLGTVSKVDSYSIGVDLNNQGTVVGSSGNTTPAPSAIWEGGTLRQISPANPFLSLVAVNDHGQIAGTSPVSGMARSAILMEGSSVVYLGAINGGGYSEAADINNLGHIVGQASFNPGTVAPEHGFLWTGGAMTDMGEFRPQAINDADISVGTIGSDGRLSAAMWANGTISVLNPSVGSAYGKALDINTVGAVVGNSYRLSNGLSGYEIDQATLWVDGKAVPLISDVGINSFATGINDFGQIVGNMQDRSWYGSESNYRAFLWQNDEIIDLDQLVSSSNPGWHIQRAAAINNRGQILAQGTFSGGQSHAVLISLHPYPSPQQTSC